MHRLSLVVASGGYSLLLVHRLLIAVASLIVGVGSWHTGFGSCGAWAYLPHHMWNLPGPGIKPMSLALAGRVLSTAPPGKFKLSKIKYNKTSVH